MVLVFHLKLNFNGCIGCLSDLYGVLVEAGVVKRNCVAGWEDGAHVVREESEEAWTLLWLTGQELLAAEVTIVLVKVITLVMLLMPLLRLLRDKRGQSVNNSLQTWNMRYSVPRLLSDLLSVSRSAKDRF
jgi:hypothetical protein